MDPLDRLKQALEDRYTIERELGRGGMATVYLARDVKHDRLVAVKVLRPDLAAVLGGERFLREIRLTAQLQHPHILPLLDSGEAESFLYYVMPYIEGESLRELLTREGQLPIDEALRVTKAVAGALDYAHQRGVIHRDIKPENILLHQGEPMVADFGVALAAATAGQDRLTETGLSLGTPAYMSPEQASASSRLDARSDQYSLACVVYEMLAGEPPYTGPTAQAIIAKRFSEPIPHLSTVRDVPRGLEAAVTRALARAPADRFASTIQFAAAFERPADPQRQRRRWVVAVGALVLLISLGALAYRWRTPQPGPAALTHRQLTFTGRASAPALSPDNRWLAYASDGRLLVQDLTSQSSPLVLASGLFLVPLARWSPDGSRLFYQALDSSGWAIRILDPKAGSSKRLAPELSFDLTRTGDALYASSERSDTVLELDPLSGAPRRHFSLLPLATSVHSLSVSPDARWLAFIGVKGSVTFLGVSRTNGSMQRRLVDGVPRNGSLAWSPESDAIYYLGDLGNGANVDAAGDVMRLRVKRQTGEAIGGPSVVLGGAFVQGFSLSADGKQLAYTKAPPQQKLWAMTLDGPASHPTVQARELSTGTSIHGTPDISPDGRAVVFARNDGGAGNLYTTPFDRYEPRPLVTSPGDEWSPRWSPDGHQVAFASRDTASPGILIADVASGEVRRISKDGLAPLGVITWLPNGQDIVFPLDLGRHYEIRDVQSGRADTLAAPAELEFHFTVPSPDGRYLVVDTHGNLPLDRDLLAVERSGRPWKWYHATDSKHFPFPLLWTRDNWIYFMTYGLHEPATLWRIRGSGGRATKIAALPQTCSFWQTSLSADARRLVCTVGRAEPDVWLAENFTP